MKNKMSIDDRIIDSLNVFIEVEKIGIKHGNNYNERKVLKRPQGLHVTKDEHKNCAMKECAFKA